MLSNHADEGDVPVHFRDMNIAQFQVTLRHCPRPKRLLEERPFLAEGQGEPPAPSQRGVVNNLHEQALTAAARLAGIALQVCNRRQVTTALAWRLK